MGFVAVLFHLLFFVTFSVFSTRTNLEKKLAQTTTKYEEEKASVKKHHSTFAKVWISLVLFLRVKMILPPNCLPAKTLSMLFLFAELLFSFQSLQQDVETQKTMVRHLEKRVQQVELDAQEKVCKDMFNRIFCSVSSSRGL